MTDTAVGSPCWNRRGDRLAPPFPESQPFAGSPEKRRFFDTFFALPSKGRAGQFETEGASLGGMGSQRAQQCNGFSGIRAIGCVL